MGQSNAILSFDRPTTPMVANRFETEPITSVIVDDEEHDTMGYARMHHGRIEWTLGKLKEHRASKVVELGSHPWVMTAELTDDPDLQLLASISAEESLLWPDDIEPSQKTHEIVTRRGNNARIKTYCFNIERRRAAIEADPDAVLACEIIEHLIRSPHVMLLNINDWLKVGGLLIVTTPNGCQLTNPLSRSPRMPAYRAHCYERHSYVYSLPQLLELVELCGFEILESGYSSPYPCTGMQRIRKMLASIPGRYLSDKFDRMLYLVARKTRDVSSLSRTPSIYAPSQRWEYIDSP